MIRKLLFSCILALSFLSCRKLEKDEIARIRFSLEGDFGQEYSEIVLTNRKDFIEAALKTTGSAKLSSAAILDKTAIIHFDKFLKEFRQVETVGSCTSLIECVVITQEETIRKTNVDCDWRGFQDLRKSLFPNFNFK